MRFGVVSYADVANTWWRLTDAQTRSAIRTTIPQGSNSGSNMAAGIQAATTMLNTQIRADVSHYHKFIILVAAKPSSNSAAAITAADTAKADFIEVLSVGVGPVYDASELKAVASDDTMLRTSATFLAAPSLDLLPVLCHCKSHPVVGHFTTSIPIYLKET